MPAAEILRGAMTMPCECCGEEFVDEVGLLLAIEAAEAFQERAIAKAESDRAAYAEALAATERARTGA